MCFRGGYAVEMAVETWGMTAKVKGGHPVDNLYMRVPEGSAYLLLGPAGSGKTTLLKILLGLKRYTFGEGICLGHNLVLREEHPAIREKAALVEEENRLYPVLKVKDMIKLCRGFYSSWDEELTQRYLQDLVSPDDRVSVLSSARKNLLALVLALAPRPRLLLLDEPSFQYDAGTRDAFFELLQKEVIAPGNTLLMASRCFKDAERMAHQVGLFYRGRLLETLPSGDSRLQERHIKVYFQEEPPPGFWEKEGISRVHPVIKGDYNYLVSVVDNFSGIWEACRKLSPVYLEEVPVDFEILLKPYLEEEAGKHD